MSALANLLLARASARQREIAVRLALGAGRARVVRQMLIESLLLAVLSGAVGILTARAALRFIRFLPTRIPRLAEVQVDWTVLAFALLVSLPAGLVFGLVPALQHSKADLSTTLREGGRGSGTSGRTSRLRRLLIASELALAVVLMVGAGLLLRTFFVLLREAPGFNPAHVVTAGLWLPAPNNPGLDRYGIDEDPVTGSAHCCLAPFWSRRLAKTTFVARQLSARGGILKVRLDGDRVRLGGQAVTVLRSELVV